MDFNIDQHTIFLCLTGSRAYGTNNEDSDWDIKGIAIAPLEYYLGVGKNFEQYEGKLSNNFIYGAVRENHESVIYDIRKFCQLAIQNNPNILEILFLKERYWLMDHPRHWVSYDLIDNRDLFLSKKCRYTYAGYAHAQLKRIRSHRQWLLNPPKDKPVRKDFGLPEQQSIDHNQLKAAISLVDKQIEQWTINPQEEVPITVLARARESIIDLVANIFNLDNATSIIIRAACNKFNFDSNFSEVIVREKSYKAALNQWNQYLTWKNERNEKRSILEAKYGYDTKHAMHLVRLLRTCSELLTQGKLIVNRLDAEELVAIRNGAWSYENLETYAEEMDKRMDVLYNSPSCPLPYSPAIETINQICMKVIESFYNG